MFNKLVGMVRRHIASALGGGLIMYGYDHGITIEQLGDLLQHLDLLIGTLLVIYAGGESVLEKLKTKEMLEAANGTIKSKKPETKKARIKRRLNQ